MQTSHGKALSNGKLGDYNWQLLLETSSNVLMDEELRVRTSNVNCQR